MLIGIVSIPSSRRTFDRRLKTISITDVKQRISVMGDICLLLQKVWLWLMMTLI
jgi:hypothetical protein